MRDSICRREFLCKTGRLAGGIAASAVGARIAAAATEQANLISLSSVFPRYTEFDPLVPVYCVTPELTGCFHRFFNTSPISPSGRYLAVTRLLHEDRLSAPDEEAEIVLVDLQTGQSRVLAKTKGFDSQLGAQAQWGATDRQLFFNDLDTKRWHAYCVRMDPLSGERRELDGPLFEVSQDGRQVASICLLRSAITQRGYGVVVPTEVLPWNEGAVSDDGVYVTDADSGKCRLVASYKDIADACGEEVLPAIKDQGGGYHGHQISWNPQGTRLMLCLAYNYPRKVAVRQRKLELSLITLKPDGSDIRVALPARIWRKQPGNHPCWCPDGEHISMNLMLEIDGHPRYSLVRMRFDGAGLAPMTTIVGSGHPTLHPDGRHILTDAYLHERQAHSFKDGTLPIRWIDCANNSERMLVRIGSQSPYLSPRKAMRLDPHPAWDRTFTRVAFNACPTGTRRVYIADIPKSIF